MSVGVQLAKEAASIWFLLYTGDGTDGWYREKLKCFSKRLTAIKHPEGVALVSVCYSLFTWACLFQAHVNSLLVLRFMRQNVKKLKNLKYYEVYCFGKLKENWKISFVIICLQKENISRLGGKLGSYFYLDAAVLFKGIHTAFIFSPHFVIFHYQHLA